MALKDLIENEEKIIAFLDSLEMSYREEAAVERELDEIEGRMAIEFETRSEGFEERVEILLEQYKEKALAPIREF